MTVVWKDEDGNYYMAGDSGCSCPTPFESVTLEGLEKLTAHEVAESLLGDFNLLDESEYYWNTEKAKYARPQIVDLISKIMND